MRNLDQIIEKLLELRDAYDDQGFPEMHDNIHVQIISIDYDQDQDDENLINELNQLVDQLDSHLNYVKNLPDFNWIFG